MEGRDWRRRRLGNCLSETLRSHSHTNRTLDLLNATPTNASGCIAGTEVPISGRVQGGGHRGPCPDLAQTQPGPGLDPAQTPLPPRRTLKLGVHGWGRYEQRVASRGMAVSGVHCGRVERDCLAPIELRIVVLARCPMGVWLRDP